MTIVMRNNLKKMRFLHGKAFGCCACIIGLLVLLSIATPAVMAAPSLVDELKQHQASLQGEDLPVSMIMQAISRQTGINIYLANNIKDTISINMNNLTLYDIFQLIIDTKKLHFQEKNNIILVEKKTDVKDESPDLTTEKLCSTFINVSEYVKQLEAMLGPGGSITSSSRGACLLVHDQPDNIDKIKKILAELDQPIPQVHIEARIVSISQEAIRRLGIKWDYDNLSMKSWIFGTSDLSVQNPTTDLSVGFLRDNMYLNVELQALQENNELHILSAPSILVLDGKSAEIKQGKEVAYSNTTAETGAVTSFREATLSLKVTPKILSDNYVVLDVTVTNDSVDPSSSGSQPLINKQEITTNLFLENNLTVVVGGIRLQTADKQKGGVPVLSKIPLLGHLFSNSEKTDDESELLVFITPTIVSMPSMAKADTAELAKQGVFGKEISRRPHILKQEEPRPGSAVPVPGPGASPQPPSDQTP